MANKKNEAKVTFTAETSEWNENIKKAESSLKELRSELRLNSEQMKTTGETAEGLSRQQEILEKEATQYENKVEALNKKLESAVRLFGEESIEAEKLRTTINNTRAAHERIKQEIAATETALAKYNAVLEDSAKDATDTRSAYEKLSDEIDDQKRKVEDLSEEYKSAVIQFGKNSDEAKELATRLKAANQELNDSRSAMDNVEREAKQAAGEMDDLADSARDVDDGFTVAKGALATFTGNAMTGLVDLAKEGASTLYNLADETREYRAEMNKLSSAAEDNGYSVEYAKEKYLDMYSVLADETAANTTVSNFMAMRISQEQLNKVLNASTGIWAKYGDSIPLDGLAESINETANVATVTGNLADALNWAGISEDEFNLKLQECTSTQERQNLIIETLDDTYGNLAKTYKENNKSVIEANRVTAEYNDVMADLGEEMEPITNEIKQGIAEITKAAMEMIDAEPEVVAEKIGDALEWVAENIETITKAAGVGATALGAVFAVNKVAQFTNSIRTMATTFGILKTSQVGATAATEAQTVAQLGLNTAMLANPIGIIVAGIGAFVSISAGMVAAYNKQIAAIREEMEETYGLSDAQQQLINSISEKAAAYEASEASLKSANNAIQQEYVHYQNLAKELNTIVGANGKIKSGYEERAAVIAGLLSNALGIEIELTGNVISNYNSLKESIDKVIEAKRIEATVSAYSSEYEAAIRGQRDAFNDLTEAKNALTEASEKSAEAEQLHKQACEDYYGYLQMGGSGAKLIEYEKNLEAATAAVEAATKAEKEAAQAVEDAESIWIGYNATIQNYEGLQEAIISGDAEGIEEVMNRITNSFITAEIGTEESLEKQVENMRETYENLKKEVEDGAPNVTDEMVEQAKDMVEAAEEELEKLQPSAKSIFSKVGSNANAGLLSQKTYIKGTALAIANEVNANLGSADTRATGNTEASQFVLGITDKNKDARNAGQAIAEQGRAGAASISAKATGQGFINSFNNGVNAVNTYTPGQNKAISARDGAASISAYNSGYSFSDGFAKGIKDFNISTAAQNLGSRARTALRNFLGIHSPATTGIEDGGFEGEGFAIGLEDSGDRVEKASEEIAKRARKPLSDIGSQDICVGVQEDYIRSVELTSSNKIEQSMANLSQMVEAIKNLQLVMNINGQKMATATAGDYDSVNGTRHFLKERGVAQG